MSSAKTGIRFEASVPRGARDIVNAVNAVFRAHAIVATLTHSKGNHLMVTFTVNGKTRKTFLSLSASDHRAPVKAASDLRRQIRELSEPVTA
jgi:hypothetical protein